MVCEAIHDHVQSDHQGYAKCWAQTAGIETMKIESLTAKTESKLSTANDVYCRYRPTTKSSKPWNAAQKNV